MKYSYTFPTGLTVHMTPEEKEEAEKLFEKHKGTMEKEEGGIVWTRSIVCVPYGKAMEEFCNHKTPDNQ